MAVGLQQPHQWLRGPLAHALPMAHASSFCVRAVRIFHLLTRIQGLIVYAYAWCAALVYVPWHTVSLGVRGVP